MLMAETRTPTVEPPSARFLAALIVPVAAVFLWAAIAPRERSTWLFECFPLFIVGPLLVATYRRYPLTKLLYVLIAIHAVVILVGAHYTYAEMPWFNWLRDHFHLRRNHYDRVGHFMQGFVPAIAGRGLLLRTSTLRRGRWLTAVLLLGCLGISAAYELIEWQVAVWYGSSADAFLGTQGDPWDTQEDMLMALIGATTALLLLSRLHDRQLGLAKQVTS